MRLRGHAFLWLLGAVVVAFFDGFHTHSGTTRYAAPVIWQMAWWTPLLFGASVGIGGPIYAIGVRRIGASRPRRPPPPARDLGIGFAIFGVLYFASGYLPASNGVKLAVLLCGAAVLFGWLDRTGAGAIMALVTAVTGPLVEITLVRLGTFAHLQPDFAGIPMWLPALYLCAGPTLGQIARRALETDVSARPAPSRGRVSPSGTRAEA